MKITSITEGVSLIFLSVFAAAIIGGLAFVLSESPVSNTPSPEPKYTITLYSDGKIIKQYKDIDYSRFITTTGYMYIRNFDGSKTYVYGTVTIEPQTEK
jgi:hypothetical protein